MEQRLEILFAIDSGNLWVLNTHDTTDESPICQIKTYILQQVKASEEKLITHLNISLESVEKGKTGDSCRLEIVADGAVAAFRQLENADTGSSYTLAKRCIHFLKPIFSSGSHCITVSEYIYARCVVDRLIHTSAWYGKAEARHLLSVLDQASLKLSVDPGSAVLDCYTFWFHCYCRYKMAEKSNEVYSLVERACSSMNLVRAAGKKLDQQDKETYYKKMQKTGLLDDVQIEQIPKLFGNGRRQV